VNYNNDGLQVILLDKAETIYREFRDADNQKTDPVSPIVRVYDPSGVRVVSAAPTKETTGVYYYTMSLASSYAEGIYQAYWEGTINGQFVTMDVPQYLAVQKVPWQMGLSSELVNSVRRMIGDTNPNNYRISTQDIYFYIADAVDAVQMEYNMGYTATVTPTSLSIVKSDGTAPTALAKSLFKIKCAEIILTGVLFDVLFDGANINVADIRINMRDTISGRKSLRDSLRSEFSAMLKQIKMNAYSGGSIVDNYGYNKYGASYVTPGDTP